MMSGPMSEEETEEAWRNGNLSKVAGLREPSVSLQRHSIEPCGQNSYSQRVTTSSGTECDRSEWTDRPCRVA